MVELERERAEQDEESRAVAQQNFEAGCARALNVLDDSGITLGDFLLFVLNPQSRGHNLPTKRWFDFMIRTDSVESILGFWAVDSETPLSVRDRVKNWMVARVAGYAALEGRQLTKSGQLRLRAQEITVQSVLSFDFGSVYDTFDQLAPVMTSVSHAFATSRRQEKKGSEYIKSRKRIVVAQSLAGLMREHSRLNNRVANHNGLYLYATGAQRQTISVLSHLGVSCSYTALHVPRNPHRVRYRFCTFASPTDPQLDADKQRKGRASLPGILPTLSESCMKRVRVVTESGDYLGTYDNVNILDPVAEQSAGRKALDALESGTASTVSKAHKPNAAAMRAEDAHNAFLKAGPLDWTDIIHSTAEAEIWRESLIDTICCIAVEYGGEDLQKFQHALDKMLQPDSKQIEVHTSDIYPLQTMDIDQASILGNVDVINAIHEQLGFDKDSPEFKNLVRILCGDQLTVVRIRSIIAARAGHERDGESWTWAKPIPGLFHAEMAAVTCMMVAHWGADTGTRDPSSLWFHNTVLQRKGIVLTSLPDYHVCRDLLNVSLHARVLHCLLKVSDKPDLQTLGQSITTLAQLRTYATRVVDEYASAIQVAELRAGRRDGRKGPFGDDIFEHGALGLRHLTGLRTFARLVKTGRSGHIILALKWLAAVYKAGAHPKYAREVLHLLHNILHVWPPALRDLILNNWLVNPTGTKDGWVPLDLMQEHLNFWIKKIYIAHGSNASWEWLKTISPCIDVLRKLANQVHAALGSYQGRKHTPADLTRDIGALMKSLAEHKVYELRHGRYIEGVEPVVDLYTSGLKALTYGPNATLEEFNQEFLTLQERSRVKPLQPYVEKAAQAAPTEAQGAATVSPPAAVGMVRMRAGADDGTDDYSQPQVNGATQPDRASLGGDNASDSSDSSASDELEYDSDGLDELMLSFNDEGGVDLDPDNEWEGNSSDGDAADYDEGLSDSDEE
ncbi:hypothetical protein EXIGLDRAFT_685766 [Exidia glandulosa HHB12029]|uniref:DUF6589 domain-containing protein n=1 Tax=Exidia glandulosa HHB12029 TaxID=1314781 RepID=A0A165C1C1_EXIGL|nr:hypothetical protein EXIGLDRAFT_685766 [Exidia glandulosa HHB12029]